MCCVLMCHLPSVPICSLCHASTFSESYVWVLLCVVSVLCLCVPCSVSVSRLFIFRFSRFHTPQDCARAHTPAHTHRTHTYTHERHHRYDTHHSQVSARSGHSPVSTTHTRE